MHRSSHAESRDRQCCPHVQRVVKVAYLCLEDVRGDDLTPVAVEERQSSAEGRRRDTPEDGLSDDASPAGLRLVDGLVEEVVEEQRLKVGRLRVGGGDVTKENGLDDATTTPHAGDASVVQVPV